MSRSETAELTRNGEPFYVVTFDKDDGAIEAVSVCCALTGDQHPLIVDEISPALNCILEAFIRDQLALNDEPRDNYDHDDFLEKDAG
jgi:hypothetical protein